MTDPQTPGLTEEQIAEMEREAKTLDICNGYGRDIIRALAAEVRRLQEENKSRAEQEQHDDLRIEKLTKERDAARAECERLTRAELDLTRKHQDTRAAFARAVELLRVLAYNANGQDIAHVSAARAFLAEHGGDR
jgi:predicted subunit of tRNA(5-methylaminomethyl-2-thiouridylate) methyltransferase